MLENAFSTFFWPHHGKTVSQLSFNLHLQKRAPKVKGLCPVVISKSFNMGALGESMPTYWV